MELSCHCKNVCISVHKNPGTLTHCNCSVCQRYGALWGYYHPDEVSIKIASEPTQGYSRGEQSIAFQHCSKCGCVTHYVSTEKISSDRLAVNFRMAEPSDIAAIKIRHFDGADSWTFLDENT